MHTHGATAALEIGQAVTRDETHRVVEQLCRTCCEPSSQTPISPAPPLRTSRAAFGAPRSAGPGAVKKQKKRSTEKKKDTHGLISVSVVTHVLH